MIEVGRLYQDLALKERRLELFVDRFLRLNPSSGSCRRRPPLAPVNDVLRSTVAEYCGRPIVAGMPTTTPPSAFRPASSRFWR